MFGKYKQALEKYIAGYNSQMMVYNAIILVEIIAVAGILAVEYMMHYQKDGLMLLLVLWFYLIAMAVLANLYPDQVQLFSILIIMPINFIAIPYMFLFADGGGIKSGMPVWIAFGLILVCIVTNGISFKIMLVLTLLTDVGMLAYGYYNQELFLSSEGEHYYYMDNLIAILAVSSSIGIILKYQKYLEKKQKQFLEEAMLETQQERNNAQRANAAKTSFLASMSHDIRTPMNAIVGMTDIARYNKDDKERVQDCLDKIHASSTQLLNLLNNVLDLSEIEMNELRLKESQFNLSELIENLQIVLMQMARSRKISFNVTCDIEHSNLIGDAVRLRQVLMNIISNSIKYTEAFGSVSLTVEEVACEDVDNYAAFAFEITDTGVGMTKEFIENHLFERFERSEDGYVQKIEGSGIGMNITKGILEAMEASIQVDSVVGEGSKFRVQIRFQRDKQFQKNYVQEQDGISVLDATGKNILIVEDNEINMEIIKAILERTHAHLTCAWDAEEAVDLFGESKDGHFDLILMDIQLPGMNGYEATGTIRCMDRSDAMSVPIMAMTANAFAQDVEKAFQAGMNAHIAKPVDVDELFQKMYHFLYT